MIDEVGQFPPQPVRDVHWDIGIPSELPYTVASLPFRGTVPETASFGITVPIAEQQIVEETDLDKTQVCIAELSNLGIYAWCINIVKEKKKHFVFHFRIFFDQFFKNLLIWNQ